MADAVVMSKGCPSRSSYKGAVARRWLLLVSTSLTCLSLLACQAHGANRPTQPVTPPAPAAKPKVAAAPSPAPVQPPTVAATFDLGGLRVELRERKKLRVVNWVYKKKFSAGVGLDGAFEVKLINTTKANVAVLNLENHGLVFVDTKTQSEHLVVHACKCAEPADAPSARPLKVAAGKTRKLEIADWGCGGGMWKAPPTGRYEVRYRVLGAPRVWPPARKNQPRQSFVERREACEKRLRDAKHWRKAAVSNGLQIVLRKPVRKRVRR